MKVLVVEDEQMERRALEKLFSLCFPATFQDVVSVRDGKTAIRYIDRYPYELVMLDINLPDIDGLEVLRVIREKSPESKVIMATAYGAYSYLRKALRNEAFDYIIKPYSMETFRETVGRFLDSLSKDAFFGRKKTVQEIKEYLEGNYGKDISLDDVSSLVSLDKSYLGRVFKKECGMGVFQYLNHVRIHKACSFLAEGMSVAETAYRVGFKDPAYFSKCFKAQMGISPHDYAS